MVSTESKTLGYCSVEFEERGKHIWLFILCSDYSQIRRVCVSDLDRLSSNVNEEMVVLGAIIDALGPNFRVVSVNSGPHALLEVYVNFLSSGYQQKLIEYLMLDLRFFKRCLQWTASSVFRTLDPYFMTEFIVNRLKGVE